MTSRTRRAKPAARPSFSPSLLFSHRHLILVEALLAVGLVQTLGREWLLAHPSLPAWARVLLGMALVVGLFGGVMWVVERTVVRGVQATHDVVQRIPLPTPVVFVHIAAFLALFFAYAHLWHLDGAVLRELGL